MKYTNIGVIWLMDKIEEVKEKLLKSCESKFVVFHYAEGSFEDKDYLEWTGEDYEEFLSLAGKLDIKLLYYSEMIVAEEESDEEKLAQIDLGFFFNNKFHLFSYQAEWFVEYNEQEIAKQEISKQPVISDDFKSKSANELADEMIKYLDASYSVEDEENPLEIIELRFWQSKGIDDKLCVDEPTRIKINVIESKVKNHYNDIKLKKEKEILPSLIDECVEWCKNEGLIKMNKANMNLFLAQKEISLTSVSESVLFGKVNNKLKIK